MEFLINLPIPQPLAGRELDFTCCDVEPAVLGRSGRLNFQLEVHPVFNSSKRPPLDDDRRQQAVRRPSHFENLELVLSFLPRRQVALILDCTMPKPYRGFRVYRRVERLKIFQVRSHVQCEHPS